MKAEALNKTEQAIAYIAKKGQAKSSEIAEAIGCKSGSIQSMLGPDVDRGLLVRAVLGTRGHGEAQYTFSACVNADDWRAERQARMVGKGNWQKKREYTPPKLSPRAAAACTPAEVARPAAGGAKPAGNPLLASAGESLVAPARPAGGGGKDGVSTFSPSENPGSPRSVTPAEARASAPLPSAGEEPGAGDATPPVFLLSDTGELYIEDGEDVFRFSAAETQRLYTFLHGCTGALMDVVE